MCRRCGEALDAPVVDGIAGTQLCRACRVAPPAFARAVVFGTYDGKLRDGIHALKYHRIHPAARKLGAMLAEAIAQLSPAAPAEMLVVPVPLHRTKHRQRGFTLMRLRATETQAGFTPTQRRKNGRGAFKVSDPPAVRGKHLLLVDNILTACATACAAEQSLIRAGAASVYVATLARARRLNLNASSNHAYADMHSSSSTHQPAS